MKVLQINSVCGVGSTGRIAVDLYKVLINAEHECLIAYGRGTAAEGINSFKIGNNFDNYIHVAETRLFDRHGFGSALVTKELIKKIKEYNPDIIHLQNIHGYYINIEILFQFLKEIDRPVVWTLHDCWAFTGHCAYFDYVGCGRWKTGCYSCPQRQAYPSSLLLDNSKNNYYRKKEIFTGVKNLTLVTPSVWLSELVKKSFLSEYTVKVINNGIDLEKFKPVKSDFREKHDISDDFVILGVANIWDKRKGLNDFLKLNELLKADERIIIVGVTEDQKKTLPKSIIGITRTNSISELAEIYTMADVFINPTYEDNFPTTNLEALACGTPVITYQTGGSPESIDETCGAVVEKGDINKLAEEIKKCRRNNFKSTDCLKRSKLYEKTQRYKEYVEYYKYLLNIRE